MLGDRFHRIRNIYAEASSLAPALRQRFAAAGLDPDRIDDQAALNRLPVLKKETLMQAQQADPPYAGYLACQPHEMGHVYVSPGPIFEPSLAADHTGHGMDRMFAAAGVGPGDLALNTWSYHLVPAGLLFDQGLRAVGATVIPGGTGNTELQASLLLKLPVTAFLGSTAFFETVIERLESEGHELPAAWSLRHAFLGGELGDWMGKRRRLEQRYRFRTWSCYGTADFGLIGFEEDGQPGYTIHPDRYVQICDPENGQPLPVGQAGEIVVTTLALGWPMIRFGTGDVAAALALAPDGGARRIGALQGRVGQAVKVREIFVYPAHVEALVRQVDGVIRAAAEVRREGARDTIALRVEAAAGGDPAILGPSVQQAFSILTRLKVDHLEFAPVAADAPLLRDLRFSAPSP